MQDEFTKLRTQQQQHQQQQQFQQQQQQQQQQPLGPQQIVLQVSIFVHAILCILYSVLLIRIKKLLKLKKV